MGDWMDKSSVGMGNGHFMGGLPTLLTNDMEQQGIRRLCVRSRKQRELAQPQGCAPCNSSVCADGLGIPLLLTCGLLWMHNKLQLSLNSILTVSFQGAKD